MQRDTKDKQHFVYRMDHDTGFAPHIEGGILSLCGCKYRASNGRKNVEELATVGSWIIGIGGNNTTKPDKLIYIMKVAEKLKIDEFKRRYSHGSYIDPCIFNNRNYKPEYVLVAKDEYYYFGDNAIDIPNELRDNYKNSRYFKYITETDIDKLLEYIRRLGYKYGKHGEPNNQDKYPRSYKCRDQSCNVMNKS